MPLPLLGGGSSIMRFRTLAVSQLKQLTPIRSFSASAHRNGQLSIFVHDIPHPRHDLKQSVLNNVELYAKTFKDRDMNANYRQMVDPEQSDGVLVVASSELTSWVDDINFMSDLLGALLPSKPSHGSLLDKVNVVAAVADGISPDAPGISILHGESSRILPGFGQHRSMTSSHGVGDKQASLCFSMNSLDRTTLSCRGVEANLEATVPLANTIFENGLPSVLRASTWDINKTGTYDLTEEWPLTSQHVVPETTMRGSWTDGTVPLMAVCPPRRVIASLGNIIRQIEIDGSIAPASKELEKNIDCLVTNSPSPGPVKIWACMIPEDKLLSTEKTFMGMFQKMRLGSFYEHIQAAHIDPVPVRLLVDDCQLFQVLSGGGGWGTKQGLLSLDSETRYTVTDGDADLEKFVQSFTSLHDSGGITTPGRHYVQFFVNFPRPPSIATPGTFLGTHSATLDNPVVGEGQPPVSLLPGHFGTFSSHGFFLNDSASRGQIEAKINVSGASIQGIWPVFE